MNWDKIEQLLNIVDRSITHGTKLQGITNAALAELAKHEVEAKPKPAPRPVVTERAKPEPEADPVKRREVPEEATNA